MKKILGAIVCFSIFFFACNDEDTLMPSDFLEYGYIVPQGDHDYDHRIVEWKEKGNFFILYKFAEKDMRWRYNQWVDSTGDDYLKFTYADTNYINQQLDLLESKFLNFYPSGILQKGMPLKLLLLGELDDNTSYTHRRNIYTNFDGYAIAWGNKSVLTMTAAEKNKFKTEINQAFLFRLLDKGIIAIPESFSSVSVYNDEYYSRSEMYELGFLASNQAGDPVRDFKKYMEVIASNSKVFLESPSADLYSNEGVLNALKDTKGLVRKKYKAVIDYFNELQIDIQKIGDEVEE